MSEPTPAEVDGVPEELLDAALGVSWGMGFSHVRRMIAAVMPIHERMIRAQMLAQLPPDGQGRWRQGTKNPRNLYVHQGDDETGQPVGQLYSAELAALVCDAVNAQQARGEA